MGRRLNQPAEGEQAVLSLRIDFAEGKRLGPGKVKLLEAIRETGSISAGGRALNMSYKRAWELVNELNDLFGRPVVAPKTGGAKGGGATLTALGEDILSRYRTIEQQAKNAVEVEIAALRKALNSK